MAKYFLINTVRLPGSLSLPGAVVESATEDPQRFSAAGGYLWPQVVPSDDVETAAEWATVARLNGATIEQLETIMLLGLIRAINARALIPGPAGPQGIPGVAGVAGAIGPAGVAGPQGIQGLPGVNGVDGAIGPAGPQGVQGVAGAAGAAGANGVDGAPGIDGVDGAGLTPEGGMYSTVVNDTGEVSVKGKFVVASANVNFGVSIAPTDAFHAVGVIYDAGVANGGNIRVVTGGWADVLLESQHATTRGYWLRVSSIEAGRGVTNAVTGGGSVAEHFCECGHINQSVGGDANVLVRAFVHFN